MIFLISRAYIFTLMDTDPEMRAGILENLTNLLQNSFNHGFAPEIINIGGAFRNQTLENYQDWSEYLENLGHSLLNNQKLPTWGNQSYGLFINKKGKISEKDKALSRFYKSNFDKDLETMLVSQNQDSRSLSNVISENMFEVSMEPGYALLQQASISIVEIVETKESSDGRNLIVVDANLYNLGLAKMFQYITDPILIPKDKQPLDASPNSDKSFSAMVVGNLCCEDDFLMDREVHFDKKPQTGDILVFTNTTAYFAGFEDASQIMHPVSFW